MIEGKYIAGSNSYGAQARGSGCKSEIVFSDGPIDFPHLTTADILVAMSQGAYNIYCEDVKESGLILYDQGLVTPKEELNVKQIGVPATEISVKKLKNKQVANIVLLGALVETTKIVSPKAIQKAIALHIQRKVPSTQSQSPSDRNGIREDRSMVEGRTHKPVIQSDRCHSCDVCIRGCPAEFIPEYREEEKSLRGTLYRGKLHEKPSTDKVPLPPCQEACPIHQDTRGYVSLIAEGKFKEALEIDPRGQSPACGLWIYLSSSL